MPDAIQSLAVLNKNLVAVKNSPGENVAITGELATLPGASVGAVSEVLLRYAPILDGSGIDIGRAGNTSLLITSAALTREVNQLEDSKLLPGDYWVDYLSGLIHGRCNSADGSISASYRVRKSNSSVTGSVTITGTATVAGTVNIGTMPSVVVSSLPSVTIASLPAVTGSVTLSGSSNNVVATGNVAAGTTDNGFPLKIGSVYNAAKPTYISGQRVDLQAESDGSLRVFNTVQPQAEDNDLAYGVYGVKNKPVIGTKYAYNRDISVALESFTISSSSIANWRRTRGRIDKSTASGEYWLISIDAGALPANGSVLRLCEPLKIVHTTGTDTPFFIDNGDDCIPTTIGLVTALSTTEFTLTHAAAALMSATVFYKN